MGGTDLTGQVLDDRYRVIEQIGKGAMGSVYRGERLKLGRMVAIKVLNENLPNDATRRRFEREATAMAKLEHPNCGTVLDVGVHDDRPYVVMEFVSGQNVKDVLKAGPLPVARAVEITRQVLSGLSHAHEHGIIHRDIKPANIMLSQKSGVGDYVKILDFGLARSTQDTSNLTGAMVLGTPNYMAPEQIRGGQIDHRVDLYACGIMLFELLTGAKPFHADDPMAVCMQHLTFAPPKLAEHAGGRSFGALEAVVARALAKDPAQRFASADEFSRALVDAAKAYQAASTPATAAPAAPAKKKIAAKQVAAPPKRPTPPQPSHVATVPIAPAPVASQASPPTIRDLPAARPKRRMLAIAAGGIAVAAIAVVIVATRSDAKPKPAQPVVVAKAPPPVETPPPEESASDDPIGDLIKTAAEMSAAGRREAAIDLLQRARKTYPKDARIAYHAAKLVLEKMWWADGLKLARAAIELDPEYRNDADLIKLVLKGFNTTASYDWMLAKFLREDIGAPAKPFMEDTAKSHPNPIVRKRAAAELKRYK
ncbi:MAG TPA: serine/threonine-protein kinase [Kofleriaceae bacterium]